MATKKKVFVSFDFDNDGLGSNNNIITSEIKPNGYVSNNLDCNEGNLFNLW
jgi:hypothetical protein